MYTKLHAHQKKGTAGPPTWICVSFRRTSCELPGSQKCIKAPFKFYLSACWFALVFLSACVKGEPETEGRKWVMLDNVTMQMAIAGGFPGGICTATAHSTTLAALQSQGGRESSRVSCNVWKSTLESSGTKAGSRAFSPGPFQVSVKYTYLCHTAPTWPLLMAESHRAEEPTTNNTDAKVSALKIKTRALAERGMVPGWAEWALPLTALECSMTEMLLDPTAGGRAELCRHVTGMTSHGCKAGAAKPAGGQSLECHLHERRSRLLAHPSGQR